MKSSIVLTTVLLSLALGKRKTHGFIWLDGLFGLPSQLPQEYNRKHLPHISFYQREYRLMKNLILMNIFKLKRVSL